MRDIKERVVFSVESNLHSKMDRSDFVCQRFSNFTVISNSYQTCEICELCVKNLGT